MAKSLRRATKKAAHEAKIQQLDALGTDIGEFIQQEGMTVVEAILGDFVERVKANIDAAKISTTGKISDIEIQGGDGVINVYVNPHLIYQDRGVNGSKLKLYNTPHSYKDKRPPIDAFKGWIKKKQSFLTDKNDYHRKHDNRLTDAEKAKERPFKELTEEDKIERAAWALSTKIFNEGFPPQNLYSREIPQLVDDLQQQVADFAIQAINQVIDIRPRNGGGRRVII